MFDSSVHYDSDLTEASNAIPFTLNATYLDSGIAAYVDAESSKSWHNCALGRAIVEYPVLITGNKISLLRNATSNNYLPNNATYFAFSSTSIEHD